MKVVRQRLDMEAKLPRNNLKYKNRYDIIINRFKEIMKFKDEITESNRIKNPI